MEATSEMIVEIQRDADLMLDIFNSLKKKQVNGDAIAKLFTNEVKRIGKIDTSLTTIIHFGWQPMSEKFLFVFDSGIESNDVSIFRAVVFKEWMSNSTYRLYAGDKLAIYNSSNSCSKIISEPERIEFTTGIRETCLEPNTTITINDMAWGTYNVDDSNQITALKPTIVNTGNERLIQCYHHRIKINELEGECIKEPFSVPIQTKIEIENVTHALEQFEVAPNINDEKNRKISKAEIQKAFITAMNEANELAEEAIAKNENLKKLNNEGFIKSYINENPTLVAGAGATTVVLVICLSLLSYATCKKNPLIELAEMAFLSNTIQNSNSKSMPNLTVQNNEPLRQAKSYACLLPENDFNSIGSGFSESTERFYPHLSCGNLIPSPSYDNMNTGHGIRFDVAPSDGCSPRESKNKIRPSTPHSKRKAEETRIKYAGKSKNIYG